MILPSVSEHELIEIEMNDTIKRGQRKVVGITASTCFELRASTSLEIDWQEWGSHSFRSVDVNHKRNENNARQMP